MTSPLTIRDPLADELLTPENATLVIIDFQPVQVASIVSMERRVLLANVVAVAKAARLYGLPVVLSTVKNSKRALLSLRHRGQREGRLIAARTVG